MSGTRDRSGEFGYSLVEMGVVITISGVLLGMAVMAVLPLFDQMRRLETQGKIEKISQALDQYALHNYRMPCPAVANRAAANPPYGFEQGSGAAGDTVPGNCGGIATPAQWVGMVPFATLGLNEQDVLDGWGRPITYAVSPSFALNTWNAAILTHPQCRVRDWFFQDGDGDEMLVPKNPRKARFCCAGEGGGVNAAYTAANSDLIVQDAAGAAVVATVRGATQTNLLDVSDSGNGFDPANVPFTLAPNVQVPDADRAVAVTYLLLSHGRNGFGAWDPAAGAQLPVVGATAEETENANNDRTFRDLGRISDAGYDDMMYWSTQDMSFSRFGESCVKE